jgi:hypothetical protein
MRDSCVSIPVRIRQPREIAKPALVWRFLFTQTANHFCCYFVFQVNPTAIFAQEPPDVSSRPQRIALGTSSEYVRFLTRGPGQPAVGLLLTHPTIVSL